MNPGTLTHGHTYQLDATPLTFQYETINHYVFSFEKNGETSTLRLNYTQVKNNVISFDND